MEDIKRQKRMITKTVGTIIVIFICIFLFPVGIGILGGLFGIVAGIIGAVFGAIAGIIGGIFGAIFGIFEWIFDDLFHWHGPFSFFDCNVFTLAAIVLIVVLVARSKQTK